MSKRFKRCMVLTGTLDMLALVGVLVDRDWCVHVWIIGGFLFASTLADVLTWHSRPKFSSHVVNSNRKYAEVWRKANQKLC